jgi:hypothetical protein
MITALIWYDKATTDPERPWLVRLGDETIRARAVSFDCACETDFNPDGFTGLQPGGPRAIVRALGPVTCHDPVSI